LLKRRFEQDIPHEGEPVGEGCEKYIIRTDIMFERRPMLLTSDTDKEAYRLYREAECLECEGDPLEAAKLFRKVPEGFLVYRLSNEPFLSLSQAVKLSPALAAIYGL
jgi:hypothetical protein